ncbi:MAG: hypothetical protein LR015_09775 [Verrucomicrobia bacterium]|nr:hypothetical protein [Verrucomicrobiota bacterium]
MSETTTVQWQGLTRGESVLIPAGTQMQILWDLGNYICAYPTLKVADGADSTIALQWAESLYVEKDSDARCDKGFRDACAGKYWLGFGDEIHHPGGNRSYSAPWWRSGRWLRILVSTADEPLTIHDVRPLKTAYPFRRNWEFNTDQDFTDLLELCENGLRNCVHETFVDCPYYEQMQYVGDTRVQALTWLTACGDPRPVKRALELFNRSRWVNGFIAERCPTHDVQMSATYSLIQPLLLRDFAWWTDDPDFVRSQLPGTRSALEEALACTHSTDLPTQLPGWLFVDWVNHPNWHGGVPGGHDAPLQSPVLLHLPLALRAMAQLEDSFGEPLLAQRWRNWAQSAMNAIFAQFWHADRALLADDSHLSCWSEHAQALALDFHDIPPDKKRSLLNALLSSSDSMAKASIYFSFHVHEALLCANQTEAFLQRLEFWQGLAEQGFKTTPEAPEPARSDCHGWGAHPLYHCLSSLAGIRPAAPGFKRGCYQPSIGPLKIYPCQDTSPCRCS